MKSERLMAVSAVVVFAVLTSWVPLAAQDKQDHNQHRHARYTLTVLPTLGGTFGPCRWN